MINYDHSANDRINAQAERVNPSQLEYPYHVKWDNYRGHSSSSQGARPMLVSSEERVSSAVSSKEEGDSVSVVQKTGSDNDAQHKHEDISRTAAVKRSYESSSSMSKQSDVDRSILIHTEAGRHQPPSTPTTASQTSFSSTLSQYDSADSDADSTPRTRSLPSRRVESSTKNDSTGGAVPSVFPPFIIRKTDARVPILSAISAESHVGRRVTLLSPE